MSDKPHLFATDTSKRSQALDNIPGNMDKPHLFAADTSKRSQTLDIIPDNIRKRRSISVKEKLDILNMVDSGCKLTAVARTFGISSSTASTIVKERHKIKLLSDHYNIDPDRKRMRLGIYRDVDEAVHMWFRQMRMKNIPINGPMLQQKAREFASQLGHQSFEGSSGWLFRFRERHGLSVKNMRDNDDTNNCCSGVGMTDDEIVTSVSQNAVHTLSFSDKDKNSLKQGVLNYLVPDIELNYSETTPEINDNQHTKFNDCESEVDDSNIDKNDSYKDSIPSVVYEKEETSLMHDNSGLYHMYNNSEPYEYTDSAMEFNERGSLTHQDAVSLANKLTSFLKEHDVPANILHSMNSINNFIEFDLREQMKQKKITDYFKP